MDSPNGLFTWVDFGGGHRMFVVGFTEGGAPHGVDEWADQGRLDPAPGVPSWDGDLEPF